jgi:hypothetical protein
VNELPEEANRPESLFKIGAAGIGRKQDFNTENTEPARRSTEKQQGASRAALERAECAGPCNFLVLRAGSVLKSCFLAADRARRANARKQQDAGRGG